LDMNLFVLLKLLCNMVPGQPTAVSI
ncbi:hypothetical protein DBR06_SOUSAS29310014, partial [Sousa chinensis]